MPPRIQPVRPPPPRAPGANRTNTPNANAARPQAPAVAPGETKPTFGTSGGFGSALSQGLAFTAAGAIGSSLLGGSSALDNLSSGVGDAIGDIGGGIGDLASGTGSAVGSVGAGAAGLATGVGGGISNAANTLPYLAAAGALVAVIFLMKK